MSEDVSNEQDTAVAPPFETFPLPEQITGLDPSAALDLGAGGQGIAIDEERGLLFSSNGGGGFSIVDVTDPAEPVQMGTLDGDELGSPRDVDVVRWDNVTYAVLSASATGIHIVDTSDPEAPVLVSTADTYGSHTLTWLPGTPYVYNSNGFQPQQLIPVLDLTDPAAPKDHVITIPPVIGTHVVQSDGCHDVVLRPDLGMAFCAGGGSYYVAGGGETLIMDISADPLDPEFIGVVDNPSIMYHHQALASEDGSLLFINDEFIAPNCQGVDTPVGRIGQTTAAMWVYDISDPTAPELVSWVQPDVPATVVNCGSHFGDLIDGTDFVVWGWYGGGTLLIDVSDPAAPEIVEQLAPTGSTWESRYWNGHVFGSAGNVDVFRVV